jgi:hypothetical protein
MGAKGSIWIAKSITSQINLGDGWQIYSTYSDSSKLGQTTSLKTIAGISQEDGMSKRSPSPHLNKQGLFYQ